MSGALPERVLSLEGGRNLRDLGGYPTEDGRTVRWGMLFRSGSLHGLAPEGHAHFRALGLRAICDLRTSRERETEPHASDAFGAIDYFARDYVTSFAELRKTMEADLGNADTARRAMIAGYRELPFDQAPAYAQLFAFLKAGQVPLLFNCTAGKDRAGTAAALVLSALGVPRDTVIEDYLLTNTALDLHRALGGGNARPGTILADPEVRKAVLLADADYLSAAFEAIDARHGGIEGYARDVLDVDAAALQAIRDALLE